MSSSYCLDDVYNLEQLFLGNFQDSQEYKLSLVNFYTFQ